MVWHDMILPQAFNQDLLVLYASCLLFHQAVAQTFEVVQANDVSCLYPIDHIHL